MTVAALASALGARLEIVEVASSEAPSRRRSSRSVA
jgi:hypothetical protein